MRDKIKIRVGEGEELSIKMVDRELTGAGKKKND
jgi:hypothetical protein